MKETKCFLNIQNSPFQTEYLLVSKLKLVLHEFSDLAVRFLPQMFVVSVFPGGFIDFHVSRLR